MALPGIVQLDYTSRDFLSFRQQALDLASKYMPEWTDHSESDFGVVLVELAAAMADILSYYTDRVAAEFLIDYVTQRSSMVELMKLIGYTMSPGGAAVVTLQVTASDAAVSEEILPLGAQFGSAGYTFEVTETRTFGYQLTVTDTDGNTELVFVPNVTNYRVGDVVEIRSDTKAPEEATVTEVRSDILAVRVDPAFPAGFLVADNAVLRVKKGLVNCQEGSTVYGEVLGSSDGSPGQRYTLRRFPVIPQSEVVVVMDDTSVWTRVSNFLNSDPDSRHYTITFDAVGRLQITFGDGNNGAIPPLGTNNLLVTYRVGGSAVPNTLQPGAINRLLLAPQIFEKVINLESPQGGADAETIEHAREVGPLTLAANDRVVNGNDYKALALSVPGVEKASPQASEVGWQSVDLYLVPTGGGLPTDALKDLVREKIEEKQLMTLRVWFPDPIYYPIDITLTIQAQINSLASQVQGLVAEAIADFFTLENVDFAKTLYLSDLTNLLEDVEGVSSLVYDKFTVQPYVKELTQSGNPIFGPITVFPGSREEVWTVQFLEPSLPDTFSVTGSVSGFIGGGTIGTTFTHPDQFSFLITAGTQPPATGDGWEFKTEKYLAQKIVVETSQIPVLGTLTLSVEGGQ